MAEKDLLSIQPATLPTYLKSHATPHFIGKQTLILPVSRAKKETSQEEEQEKQEKWRKFLPGKEVQAEEPCVEWIAMNALRELNVNKKNQSIAIQ